MADDITPLASLSLTHVYYNPDDPVSLLCAWLALVPQALCVIYVTLIWSTREAEVALMFAGQLACEAVNFALKRLIKEERPARIHRTGGKGYGMPSSHAQFACFWAVALTLFLLARHRPSPTKKQEQQQHQGPGQGGKTAENGVKRTTSSAPRPGDVARSLSRSDRLLALNADIERFAHEPWSFAQRALVSAGALFLAGMVAWSRTYLGYHTAKQVLVGCLAGAVSAVGWFGITQVVRQTGMLALALEIPVARWFRLRDLVVEEDLCQAGWEKWEGRRLVARQLREQKKAL
ncbi:PAP2 superfamily-domain-containing protein [Podospora appendiculata]|uniref:Dolichyldiphosphatase n=1 Tax=Podospora appendiculata TaxID=314037 RepID=A0AAE0X574_9PEZI|nr:PAP2 superfamily-domain-containing protein [Podospora appendiculata]